MIPKIPKGANADRRGLGRKGGGASLQVGVRMKCLWRQIKRPAHGGGPGEHVELSHDWVDSVCNQRCGRGHMGACRKSTLVASDSQTVWFIVTGIVSMHQCHAHANRVEGQR